MVSLSLRLRRKDIPDVILPHFPSPWWLPCTLTVWQIQQQLFFLFPLLLHLIKLLWPDQVWIICISLIQKWRFSLQNLLVIKTKHQISTAHPSIDLLPLFPIPAAGCSLDKSPAHHSQHAETNTHTHSQSHLRPVWRSQFTSRPSACI